MPTNDEKVIDIEKHLVSVDHRLNTSEEILREIKNVIVDQNRTIIDIVKLQEKQQNGERDFEQLKENFEHQKDKTDKILDDYNAVKGKVYGVILAATFFIVIIQACVTYIWNTDQQTVGHRLDQLELRINKNAP